jgi:hypothetical protein
VKKEERLPLFICGDFWDASLSATEHSGYSQFIDAMSKINNITNVFMITGTPLHDPQGSYKVFEVMGINVFYKNTYKVFNFGNYNFELIAIPEPRKSHYISKTTDINKEISLDVENFINSIPQKSDTPRIAIYHGEVVGHEYQNGIQCTSPIGIKPSLLKKLNCDFYGLGHIHDISSPFDNCWYLGSCPPKKFGETHNASYFLVEVE